jgi:DNA-binding transcriptional LysR family regulator
MLTIAFHICKNADVLTADYDWNDLKYFLACWRTSSLLRAGQRLGVDQTTVARRLVALEKSIGARLFERSSGGLELTPTGNKLLDVAQVVEAKALDLANQATGADKRIEGTVRLATNDTLALTFLLRDLAVLNVDYPGIELELLTGTNTLNLLKGEADLAVRAGVRPSQKSLVVRKLNRHDFGLYASHDYRKRHPHPGNAGPLDGHTVIGFSDELAAVPPMKWLTKNSQGSRTGLRVNSILSAAEAARAGWGIATLPAFIGDRDPELVRVHDEAIAHNDLWLVMRPELQHIARIRVVIKLVEASLKRAGLVLK